MTKLCIHEQAAWHEIKHAKASNKDTYLKIQLKCAFRA